MHFVTRPDLQLVNLPACIVGAISQAVELKATRILHLGQCDNTAGRYPVAKKKQTLEYLREKAHLRARTNTIGAVARIRNALAFATHEFFQSHGFLYVHTPVITTSDAEGAGELFQVRADCPVPEWGMAASQPVQTPVSVC